MNKKETAKTLVNWYEQNKRDLPWRKTKDPYCIWLSEVMLQQTQVQTVIPYYRNFLSHFPNVHALANATLEEIYKCWEGLGYYSRARHLHEAAKQIVEQGGNFPTTYQDLLQLKGIGPYTAAAISSIAFEFPKGVVDGNVLRIIARVFEIDENIALTKTRKHFQSICDEWIHDTLPSSFNQALMDLGATICKPKNPSCTRCPLCHDCLSYQNHKQALLPVNIKNIKRQENHFITCLITWQNKLFLIKNKEGLLAHLYGLPQYEVESPFAYEERFLSEYHVPIQITEQIQTIKHIFTHRTWYMHIYFAHFLEKPKLPLYALQDISELAISTAHKKVLQCLYKSINRREKE